MTLPLVGLVAGESEEPTLIVESDSPTDAV